MPEEIRIIVCFPKKKPLFDLGEVFISAGAKQTLQELNINIGCLIVRHIIGDYGEVTHDEIAENKSAIKQGESGRILSQYHFHEAQVWIETHLGRTTIFLPDEYDYLEDL